MNLIERDGIKAFFLDPNDAAVSKYTRGAENDLRWIHAGVEAGRVDLETVRERLRTTSFMDSAESHATRARVESDLAEASDRLLGKRKGPGPSSKP